MEIQGQLYKCMNTLCILIILYLHLLQEVVTETVYMDRYGDCFHEGPINVEDEAYTIQSQGGAAYDTLICEMTFKSIKNDRLCLSFKKFQIDRCDLKVYAYSDETSSNTNIMGTYTCHTEDHPESVCSEGKYLTVLMKKQELSRGGYDFTLELRQYSQSDAFAEGIDAFIVSISVIVGIIVGVIAIVVLTAVIIVCCCCKNKTYRLSLRNKSSTSGRTTDYANVQPVQPSAPPLENPPAYSEHPPPYCTTGGSASIPLNASPYCMTNDSASIPLNTDISHNTDESKACVV